MAWVEVASAALDSNATGLANITFRQRIENAGLSNSGLPKWRVAFMPGAAKGLNISKAYIAQAADSGDPYDYAGAPTQLLFSGNPNTTIAAGGTVVSDETTFPLAEGKNLIVTFVVANDLSNDSAKYKVTLANWQYYFKGGDDATTQNATGYTTATNDAIGISLIEASASDASNIKKVSGVAYASIKKIAGVAIASVKKVIGV